jgi:hypothetical protein
MFETTKQKVQVASTGKAGDQRKMIQKLQKSSFNRQSRRPKKDDPVVN